RLSRPTRNDSDMKLARFHFTPVVSFAALTLSSVGALAQPVPQRAVPEELDLKTAIGFALENNFAIRQARERIKQQEGIVIEVSARAIPNVSAAASGERLRLSALGSTVEDNAWSIGINASQVLYAGGGVRANVKSAKLAREAAILDMQSVINEALLEVRTAFYNVLLAAAKIK